MMGEAQRSDDMVTWMAVAMWVPCLAAQPNALCYSKLVCHTPARVCAAARLAAAGVAVLLRPHRLQARSTAEWT